LLKKLINKALQNPKKLFLVDAFGAGITAILLGIVLPHFEPLFGIPKSVLHFLALVPISFIIYDLFGYSSKNKTIGLWLKGIAFLNISYCIISLVCALLNQNEITFWGWYYIISEVLIILLLVIIELKVAKQVINQKVSYGKE